MSALIKRFGPVSLLPLVVGCGGPESESVTSRFSEVTYQCEQGSSVQVRFRQEQESAVLIAGDQTFELRRERTASGFSFRSQDAGIRGKGKALSVVIGSRAPIDCQAQ